MAKVIEKICSNCGYLGKPKKIVRGAFLIELILWLCFLVPGFIYTVWRLTSQYDVCPKCGS
jgi:hypothetical protein